MGKKRRRKKSKLPFDLGRNPIGVFLSVLSLVLLVVALVLETGLSWAAVGASMAATAGWKKYDDHRQRKLPPAKRRPTDAVPPPKREPPKPAPGQPRTKIVIKCTNTGKDIDVCDCASRHIRKTPNQYKKPVGTPYGIGKNGKPVDMSKKTTKKQPTPEPSPEPAP